jgi:uncharacterized membrane protein (DUF4010 family)
LADVLGGIISSTATTVTYSKRAAKQELAENAAALVILLASTVSRGLVLVEIGVVAPGFLRTALAPLSIVYLALLYAVNSSSPGVLAARKVGES